MRILFLSYEFPMVGQEEGDTAYCLMQQYAKNPQIQIDFVTASLDGQYHLLQMNENISIHRLPVKKNMADLRTLKTGEIFSIARQFYGFSKKLAKSNRYDVTHAFGSFPAGVAALFLTWSLKIPYIISLHSVDVIDSKKSFAKYLVSKAWKRTCFSIANTPKLKDFVAPASIEKEIVIIEKGYDTEMFFPDASKHKTDKFLILCDSEVTPIKGVRALVQAFKILSSRFRQIQMVVLGDGNEKKSLENLAQGLDINDQVVFAGWFSLQDSLKYYQAADVFVMPSIDQACDNGVSIRRAMGAGLPIIATAVSSVDEVLHDGENGFLVGLTDPDAIAEKIEKLILDQKLKETMGSSSLLKAQQSNWIVVADKYMQLYTEAGNVYRIQLG